MHAVSPMTNPKPLAFGQFARKFHRKLRNFHIFLIQIFLRLFSSQRAPWLIDFTGTLKQMAGNDQTFQLFVKLVSGQILMSACKE